MKTLTLWVIGLLLITSGSFADDAAKPNAVVTPAPESKAAESTSPKKGEKAFTGEALKVKNQLVALFEASQKVGKNGENEKARNIIEAGVDWDRIAKDCLGNSNWNRQSVANRDKFKTLLRKVVSKTAYSRMDSFWTEGTSYKFTKIDVKGKTADVKCKFVVKDDSVPLEYFLQKKGDKWVIYDIAYDDLRYSENINEQIAAFLKDGKFAGLLDKLQKRLEELNNADNDEDAKPKAAPKKS